MKYKKILLFMVVVVAGVALRAPKAHAATINVTTNAVDTNNGSGNCSLYEAVESAETGTAVDACTSGSAGADTINIPDGTYTLTQDLAISTTVTLDGASRAGTIIDGDGQYGINATDGGTNPTLTIRDLAVTNSDQALYASNQNMSFVLDNTAWHDNFASGVGNNSGIVVSAATNLSRFGSFTMTDTIIYDNISDSTAGLTARFFTTITISGSEIYTNDSANNTDNTAVSVDGVDVSITNTDIRDNDQAGIVVLAQGIDIDRLDVTNNTGGGAQLVPFMNPPGILSLHNSSIAGNGAAMALYISSDTGGYDVDIYNVTVSGNTSLYPAMSLVSDENDPISGTISNVTIANNIRVGNVGFTAPASMLFMSMSQIEPTVTLQNMLVSNNTSDGDPQNCAAIPQPVMFWPTSLGHNLSDDDTCSGVFDQASDLNNVSAGLDALMQDSGTWVLPLQASSPANDGGATVLGISTDQRGTARPQNGAFDIGAYETTLAPTGAQQGGGSGNGGSGGGSNNSTTNSTASKNNAALGETGQKTSVILALASATVSLVAISTILIRTRHKVYRLF